jgi:putative transposase
MIPAWRDGHRERHHRLPRVAYRGNVTVSFHACIAYRRRVLANAATFDALLGILDDVASRHACAVRAYCFMPDHLHVILRGTTPEADIWAAMVDLKQRTGLWLAANAGARWQKDFYDEILRSYEQAQDMISYVLRTR